MARKFIKQLAPSLSLCQYNDIPVVELEHSVGTAKIALQGAHLFSWQPSHTQQDVLWLSEIEPFQQGNAIRGGIPICYPWFGATDTPFHGYARISLWELTEFDIQTEKVRLEFQLFSAEKNTIAKITMEFSDDLSLSFQGFEHNTQLALHSYFNLGDIEQTLVHNLPETCFNSLIKQEEKVPSPRAIQENVDCIYRLENPLSIIEDREYQRHIEIEHINASEIVLWNPWHKPTGSMSEIGYKTMVCVETARIHQPLNDEIVSVKIRVK